MKFLKFLIMVIFLQSLFMSRSFAQSEIYACQFDYTAGMKWSDGEWKVSAFLNEKPFFIKLSDGIPTDDNRRQLFTGRVPECVKSPDSLAIQRFTCASDAGEYLFFNMQTEKGAHAWTWGAGNPAGRDTPMIGAFTCQKM